VTGVQLDQRLAEPRSHHRLHGVGQHQHLEAPVEGVPHHPRDVRVHERLAAGEADLARAQPQRLDLVEQARSVPGLEIAQPIVLRSRLDVAVEALDVAQRAGVDPQRIEPRQADGRPGLALGGDVGIPELGRKGRKVRAIRLVGNVCHDREASTFPRAHERIGRPSRKFQASASVARDCVWSRQTAKNPVDRRSTSMLWKGPECGCSSMAEQKLPKLTTRVRFPSPAPSSPEQSNSTVGAQSATGDYFHGPATDRPAGPRNRDVLARISAGSWADRLVSRYNLWLHSRQVIRIDWGQAWRLLRRSSMSNSARAEARDHAAHRVRARHCTGADPEAGRR
jgi:hypothetical protein